MDTSLAPHHPPSSPSPPSPPPPPVELPRLSVFSTALIAVCGILMPIVTNLIEALTHMCADAFFDPLPTVGHVFAVAAVPLANAAALWVLKTRDARHLHAVMFAQGGAAAVATVYSLLFLPLTPIGLFAVVWFGLGLLPLTPLLSQIASWRALAALSKLRRALALPRRRAAWAGLAAGVGALMALSIPATLTRVMLVRAASDDPAVSRSAITWLRRIGQRDLMLRAASGQARGTLDPLSVALDVVAPIHHDKTREIYYRVTGRPIETEAVRRVGGNPLANPLFGRRDDWDINQASDQVGVVALRGLSLASSRFDGSVDGRAALAYVEWTFELRNAAPIPREARAELALPPGGVVSRVTLWIDGVEHEAAFAGRDVSRRAYERVVGTRRDPILVTTSAPDRVLVQCFPVPPNGGVMKARIGITAPLRLADRTAGTLGLPYFTQRNFDVPAGVKHALWIASKDSFADPTAPLLRERTADGGEEIRGKVPEPGTPSPFAAVTVARSPALTYAWTPERPNRAGAVASANAIIRQELRAETATPPSRLIVVVDGGGAMTVAGPILVHTLRALPSTVPVAITVAGDEVVDLLGGVVAKADRNELAKRLTAVDFAGGTDSLPALAAAWDLAAETPGGAVLWIHGPQPVLLAPPEELRQRTERRKNGPVVYTYAAVGGENRLLASLGDLPSFQAVPRYLPNAEDLEAFLRQLAGVEQRIVAGRTRETNAGPAALAGVETSDHLARLWAAERIETLVHAPSGGPPRDADRREALALAARYHLVTTVSGAVVLETQAETDAVAGSDPSTQMPTVPEPETWALLGLVAVLLAIALRSRGRLRTTGAV